MRRLLCITAHPDDEAGGFGGTLLRYARQGVQTSVICLTPGQAATHRGGATSDEELAAMRRAEFTKSCKLLQVNSFEVLNYRDAALDHADFYAVVGDLALRIRRLRPQVVITFGTEGGITAHPDHSMAAIFATMAFHWASRSNRYTEQLAGGASPHRAQKLYYATSDFILPDRQPVSLPPASATIDIANFLDEKIAAFKAHTSQSPLFKLFESNARRRGNSELYLLAASSTIGQAVHETDLFAGVVED